MQYVNLFEPLLAHRKGPAPVFINVGVQAVDMYTESGTIAAPVTSETYVKLSSLPPELRERVKTAVQAILSGM